MKEKDKGGQFSADSPPDAGLKKVVTLPVKSIIIYEKVRDNCPVHIVVLLMHC